MSSSNEDSAATRQRLRRHARLFKALANESRLAMVDRLSRGECCVCDLAEWTGLDQSTVSKHLALLSASGVVDGERRGHHVYYSITAPWVIKFLNSRAGVPEDQEEPREHKD